MRAGEASITAQRVAAHRLTFDRIPADHGDPDADRRLSEDVAASTSVDRTTPMSRYLAARTTFFDSVVVGCVDAGIRQVVVAAAGYDGRALRYAKPGVRWFELDHPDTQRDKRDRLERLGITTDHISFVAADFITDDVADRLRAAGVDPDVPSLITCEGVAVYLDREVLRSLLRGLRSIAAARSRLAISLSVDTGDGGLDARRATFQRAVAAVGEPARTVVTAVETSSLLRDCGWEPTEGQERARRAGFVTATPQ